MIELTFPKFIFLIILLSQIKLIHYYFICYVIRIYFHYRFISFIILIIQNFHFISLINHIVILTNLSPSTFLIFFNAKTQFGF